MDKLNHEMVKFLGIVKDIIPVELMPGAPPSQGVPTPMVWSDGANVHFDNSSTHRVDGYNGFAEPLPIGSEPIFQLSILTPDVAYWLWVDIQTPTAPKVWVTDGTFHFDITPVGGLTGGGVGEWTGTVLNGVPVLNNGINAPIWWNGTTATPMTDLPDWPANTVCRSIRAFKFHLLAMDIEQDGVRIQEKVMWSDGADAGSIPAEWSPTPENDAGDTILAATVGAVVDGAKLRDVFIIYKQHSTYTCQYVAGQFVFNFQPLFITTGVQSVNCIKELRGFHFVFADDDVIKHDGNSFASTIDHKMRQILFDGIQPENHHMCHLAIRVPTDEVWICAPTLDSERCDIALVYSFTDDVWGIRTLPEIAYVADGIVPKEDGDFSWDEAETTWYSDPRFWNEANYSATADRLLMSQPELTKIYHIGAASDNDGADVEAWVERRDFTIGGEPNIWTTTIVRSLYPVVTGSEGDVLKVKFAASVAPGQELDWGPEQEFAIGGPIKVDNLSHGRYLNLRISSTGGNPWEVHRIGFEYILKGKY